MSNKPQTLGRIDCAPERIAVIQVRPYGNEKHPWQYLHHVPSRSMRPEGLEFGGVGVRVCSWKPAPEGLTVHVSVDGGYAQVVPEQSVHWMVPGVRFELASYGAVEITGTERFGDVWRLTVLTLAALYAAADVPENEI